jgi:hypothetical protein
MSKALSAAALTVVVVVTTLVAGCGGGGGGDDVGAAAGKATSGGPQVDTFRVCQPGPRGGGYRVRALGISCGEVRRILPRLLSSATLITKRGRERVYRNDDGWICLSQGQPRRFGFTLILCVRGSAAILYRFS